MPRRAPIPIVTLAGAAKAHADHCRKAKNPRDGALFDRIAALLVSLAPRGVREGGTVPRGWVEFRVYHGSDHAAHWKARRGGNVVASAHGYDRLRDGKRSVLRLIAAIQAGKVVITSTSARRCG
jgi:hypothetical protein